MRCVKCLLRDQVGSATIEFVLWLPVIAALLVIVIDATTLYLTHAEMWQVARDTARRMTSGIITCEEDAEAHAASAMSLRDFPYRVDATYDADTGAQVVIALRLNDMSIIGYSPLTIFGGDMVARVVMRADRRIPFGCGEGGKGGGGKGGNTGGGNSGGGGKGKT